jgi:hypothetical protein
MGRIYISSTYEDLVDMRKAALEAARRLEHQPVGMEDYGAYERQPLDRCLDDVRSCDALVGILGWRHGFVPSGESQSIARLEYEAAGKAGIPRLIFLSPPRDRWNRTQDADPSAIQAFRDTVQANHGVIWFENALDLKAEVIAALSRELPLGRRFPTLVPYFCDRFPQRRALHRVLFPPESDTKASSPLVFVLHGDQTQSHGRFIDCLKHRYVADLIEKPAEKTPVKEYQLRWPRARTADAFLHELLDGLGEAVCGRPGVVKESIATRLSDIQDPVLLTVALPVSQWHPGIDPPLLEVFTRFWADWSFALRCWPTIVLVSVQYPTVTGGVIDRWLRSRRVRRGKELVEGALESLNRTHVNAGGFGLSRLTDVPMEEALAWARSEEVRRLSGDADVEVDVRNLYDGHHVDQMPMEPLAKGLTNILQRYVTKGS